MTDPGKDDLPPAEEAELVARCQRGDTAALRALAAQYYRPVAGFLYKRAQQTGAVEQLALETFLEAFRALRNGAAPQQPLGAWLLAVAHFCCGRWLRRKQPVFFATGEPPEQPVPLEPQEADQELQEQANLWAALDAGLSELSPQARALLEARHRPSLNGATNVRPPAAASLLGRAYQSLRARLCRKGGSEP